MPLRIKTELRPSLIHGLGLFTLEDIAKDQIVWEHDAIFDGWIHANLLKHDVLKAFREYVDHLYPYDAEIESYIRAADNMNWANHSNDPNLLAPTKYLHIAARDISKDEELTVNYRQICDLAAEELGF